MMICLMSTLGNAIGDIENLGISEKNNEIYQTET